MSDIEELKQDLAELSNEVPLLPDRVEELRQSAQHVADAAATLLQDVELGKQDVANLQAHVHTLLPQYGSQVDMLEKRLQLVLGEADKACIQSGSDVAEGEEALRAAATEVNEARTEVMQALFDGGTAVDRASTDGEAAIDRIEALAADGSTRIQSAAAAVAKEVAVLTEVLERTKEAFGRSTPALLDRFKQYVDSVTFDADHLLDGVMARSGRYTDHLTEVAKEMETATDAAVMALGKRIDENMAAPLLQASENCRIQVERLGATASTHAEAVKPATEDHGRALGELRPVLDSLSHAIEQIHQAVVKLRQQ